MTRSEWVALGLAHVLVFAAASRATYAVGDIIARRRGYVRKTPAS